MAANQATGIHYLDASALVKLVAKDTDELRGREDLLAYYRGHHLCHSTVYCVGEAISAFKMKWLRGRTTQDEYVWNVREFLRVVVPGLTLQPVLLAPDLVDHAERLMRAYALDFVDCIQLATVLYGPYDFFVGESRSLLITADGDLARAAEAEGARVWDCTRTSAP